MTLLNLKKVYFSYGERPILDGASCLISHRERIAVIGRNGTGKSTLFKLIEGVLVPDDGELEKSAGVVVAKMDQTVPGTLNGTVLNFVLEGQHQQHDWQTDYQSKTVITQLGLNEDDLLSTLSGGQVRRALLARALVNEPDILLLDEPTNHLDIESILWLENFLIHYPKTVILITHDRVFMQKVAKRIFELDRGQLIDWQGSYLGFLEHKQQSLHAEEIANKNFDKRLANEEVWIRQGIKARRTRNEGRVRALEKMRELRSQRQERVGKVKLASQMAEHSGKQVFDIDSVSIDYNGVPIINNFSSVIMRGDKVGIIGRNGCGKSTLIAALFGELTPNKGTIKHGTKLEIAYFDQHRSTLDPEAVVADAVADGCEFIDIHGKRKHIISYLQDFLFTPVRARGKVSMLSGGECNRLLLARLFAKPSNVLILDEPTNDLDQETLELLEECLLEYEGTLLLVSHDRALLNNVVTSTLVFEGDGNIQEYVGGYDDWQRQIRTAQPVNEVKTSIEIRSVNQTLKQKKLSYQEKRELEALPKKIEKLEQDIHVLQEVMSQADFYKQDGDSIVVQQKKLAELNADLEKAYARWEELELLKSGN